MVPVTFARVSETVVEPSEPSVIETLRVGSIFPRFLEAELAVRLIARRPMVRLPEV